MADGAAQEARGEGARDDGAALPAAVAAAAGTAPLPLLPAPPRPLPLDDSQERARLRAEAEREATEVGSGVRCAGCRHGAHEGRTCVSCGHAYYPGLAVLAAEQRVASAKAAAAARLAAASAAQAALVAARVKFETAQAELEMAQAELENARSKLEVVLVNAGAPAASSSGAAVTARLLAPAPAIAHGAPAAHPLHPELQADPLARLFLSIAGIVMAHKQGHFALNCWRLQDVSRETRFVWGVTQRGTVADLIRGGLASSGVDDMLHSARSCKMGEYGRTQLIRATRSNDVKRVRQLICLGCPNINAQAAYGTTALHWASFYSLEAVVRELLAQGADVNVDAMGFTPLMWASCFSRLAVVRLLCDVPGVDLAVRGTWKGQTLTAFGWAHHENRADVAAFLSSRGAPE